MKETDVDVKPSAEKEQITDGGAGPRPMLLEEAEVKEVVLEEVRVLKEGKEARTIRKGSEGDDVRAMQEALQRLGFYSGEEDMEFSSYSSGTERAVKTWQASVGIPQDGIMTVDILNKLFDEQRLLDAGQNVERKDSTNGAVVASVTELSEIQQTVVKDNEVTEVEVSQHRVFLLGENRWEEPSRLVGRNKPSGKGKPGAATKCLTCRGEGRLMCTECDGTGEPNIEPQFLEWVDDDAKCPYCEGLGYTICDVCEGKTITPIS
ncbi:hypothetical protein QJS04_geneDACA015254 [Acorus gramineus]|uniref:Peptidoglycan binding-like domain-containing protein n=1 Tax=Acorus gramineus TaxID=55184 RepID=A0AAV9AR60_ACOGR|nr:hypothetical protein QJS04_geneDACA015254 [Acorus gramineus]